jgi:hypothetical protein
MPISSVRAQIPDAHRLEGKWAGMAGPPQDRVPVAFEFKRNAKGELKGYYYAFVYEALEIPDTVAVTPVGFAIKDWVPKMALQDDSLEGEVFHAPFTVGRTETLPHAPTLPDLPAGPGPTWRTPLGAAIHAPVAIHDSVAYVGTTGGMFYALRVRDGAFAWAFTAGRPIFGGASATDSAVYFPCDNGFLYKLDRLTGKEIWRYDLGDERVPRILAHGAVTALKPTEFAVALSSAASFSLTPPRTYEPAGPPRAFSRSSLPYYPTPGCLAASDSSGSQRESLNALRIPPSLLARCIVAPAG